MSGSLHLKIAMLAVILLMLGALGIQNSYAQVDSLWSKTFGGVSIDWCNSIIQTADGGFAIGGYTESFGAGESDFWLVKTNANGDSLWSHTFGGESVEKCNSLIQTADGGYALIGYTNSFGVGNSDFWLVKTDANGDSLWSKTFGGVGDDWCNSIIQTADGGYALIGCTNSFSGHWDDFWLVKTDENGDSLWSKIFGGDGLDNCHSIIQTADGGYALGGRTTSFGAGNLDFWLVRTNANGDSLWSKTFGGENDDGWVSIIQTADGGYALGGLTSSFGAGREDFWLVKTGENGDSLWSKTFGGVSIDWCNSIIQTADGGYALGGKATSFGAGREDFWLVKTDENGDSLWSKTFGGENTDGCNSIIQTADGGFALGGVTQSFGAGRSDFWLVKTGPDPMSVFPVGDEDFPQKFILLPAYPNPFNSQTFIAYNLPTSALVNLTIFDLDGRQVHQLIDNSMSAGIHNIIFDANDMATGVYLLRLDVSFGTRTQKLMLIK